MRQWRVGTVSMGLILIALGVLMLISHIQGVSILGYILKLWPAVLVILGLEIMAHVFVFKQEDSKIKYDVFSIIIISLIMVFSISAYGVTSVLQGNAFPGLLNEIGLHKYETTAEKNISVPASGSTTIDIDNTLGSVHVEKGSGDKVEIEASIIIRNNDEDYAKSIMDSLIEVTEGSTIKVKSKSQQYSSNRSKIQGITINYYIKVPEGIKTEVENRFGAISVQDLATAVKVKNNNGEISLKNIEGDISVENAFGGIKAEDIKGNAKISNSNGQITVNRLDGNLNVDNRFGALTISDVKGNVNAEDNNGKVTVKNTGGDVDVRNSFGNIDIINASKLITVKNNNGNIDIESSKPIEKNVTAENRFGGITLSIPDSQKGHFKASTQFGSINTGFKLSIQKETNKQFIDEVVGNDSVRFNLNTSNGSIKINED